MNSFAHNGHDHKKELFGAVSNDQILLAAILAGISMVAVIGMVIFLKRKK